MNLWPLFLANATALGTPSSLIYHLRKHGERREELIPTALALATGLGIVAGLLGMLALPLWLAKYPPQVIFFARIFLVAAPLWAIQMTGQAALEALELFHLSNLVQTLVPATTLAGLLVVFAFGRMTPVNGAACYVFATLPTALIILGVLWRQRGSGSICVTVRGFKTLFGYGVRSAPLDLMNTLNLYLDSVLVIGLLSASSMGSYQVVLSLSRALLMFQSAVVMVLFPKAAGRSVQTVLEMVGRSARAGIIVTGAAALAVALVGPLLIRLLYGADYLSAVPALRILAIEVVVQGAVVVVSQAFMAVGRPGTVSLLHTAGLAVAVPLMFVFIPRFGTAGAALALLCSTVTRFVLIVGAVRFVLKSPLPALIPGPSDVLAFKKIVLQSQQPRAVRYQRTSGSRLE